MNKAILEKIREKREFSQLSEKDIEMAFDNFDKRQVSEEEKIILTRKLLREVFSVFMSRKLLSLKDKDEEWILRKHVSTRERLPNYKEIYKRIFQGLEKKISVIDLGAGINGFSYKFFKESGFNIRYTAIEAIGQLSELMNFYFRKNKINGRAVHLSLFEKEEIKKEIMKSEKPRIILLFKVIDSLEMLKKDYSKELINYISAISDRIIVSFATRSIGKRQRFKANRKWLESFIKENFKLIDDFELDSERYLVFEKR